MQRIGTYQVRDELSRGGMGVLYEVRDPRTERALALKVVLLKDEQSRRRFAREASALTRLRHPHIVRIHSAGEHSGHPFLVMDLVRGGSLQDRLHRQGALDPDLAVEFAAKLARALDYIHGEGLLHRDVKPANVVVTEQGEPCLTDFGLAKDLDLERSRLTQSGASLGTPGFWSPEQATGNLDGVGAASDVYSLGATLYALLTGEPPFAGESLAEQLVVTTSCSASPPSRLNPAVDPALDRIVLRCLEKDPALRFSSAADLAEALESWDGRRVRRPPGLIAAAGGVAVAACVGLWVWLAWGSPFAEPEIRPTPPPVVPEEGPGPEEAKAERVVAADPLAERLDRAEEFLARFEPRRAQEEAEWVLREHPDDMRALFVAARARLARQQHDRLASDMLRRVFEAQPGNAHAGVLLGRTLFLIKADSEALVALGRVIEDPEASAETRAWALCERARIYAYSGDPVGAEAELTVAKRLAPEAAVVEAYTGVVVGLRSRAQALRHFEEAVRLDAAYPWTYYFRGSLLTTQPDPAGAAADYRRAIQLGVTSGAAYLQLALALLELEDFKAGEQALHQSLDVAPTAIGHAYRAGLRARLGNVEGARKDLEDSRRLPPYVDPAFLERIRRAAEEGILRASRE